MSLLRESFEGVADWCERHLETHRGREIGMTFGAMPRAFGSLAAMPDDADDPEDLAWKRQMNAQGEELLLALSSRFIVASGYLESRSRKLAEPTSFSTNMTYDPGPHPGSGQDHQTIGYRVSS